MNHAAGSVMGGVVVVGQKAVEILGREYLTNLRFQFSGLFGLAPVVMLY